MIADKTLIYAPLSKVRDDDVIAMIRSAMDTKSLALAHLHLVDFPTTQLSLITASKVNVSHQIFRLDLSNNHLQTIPSLSFLPGLQELWISRNPILSLPDVSQLHKLQVIDISYTKIKQLPPYVATLSHIHEIDRRDTPLAKWLKSEHQIEDKDLTSLIIILKQDFERSTLDIELRDIIDSFYLRKGGEVLNTAERITEIINHLRIIIPKYDDFKIFIRRVTSYLPDSMDEINERFISTMMDNLRQFQRDTKRQRLSADLDIALHNVYYDRIGRDTIEHVIRNIYDKVSLLEDIEFLIKYASQVLPPTADEALDGGLVWQNIIVLQSQLISKRQCAIAVITSSMTQLYPEATKEELSNKAEEIALLFRQERFATKKELSILARVAADADKILPADYRYINLDQIAKKVLKPKK